jgi:dUTPase
VKIKSLKKIDNTKIYYLNVEKNHNFFGNHMCLHNCDYHNNPKNEGEIFIKFHNQGDRILRIPNGESFAQAIFTPFLLADGDSFEVGNDREGGLGSTSK